MKNELRVLSNQIMKVQQEISFRSYHVTSATTRVDLNHSRLQNPPLLLFPLTHWSNCFVEAARRMAPGLRDAPLGVNDDDDDDGI